MHIKEVQIHIVWLPVAEPLKKTQRRADFTTLAEEQVSNPDSYTHSVSKNAEELDAVFQHLVLAVD